MRLLRRGSASFSGRCRSTSYVVLGKVFKPEDLKQQMKMKASKRRRFGEGIEQFSHGTVP